MGKRTVSLLALCPFYKSESAQKIYCEGLFPDSAVHMAFGTPDQRRGYEKLYCKSWKYEDCPLAKAHDKRYQEAEE